jgi:hypothetical protein
LIQKRAGAWPAKVVRRNSALAFVVDRPQHFWPKWLDHDFGEEAECPNPRAARVAASTTNPARSGSGDVFVGNKTTITTTTYYGPTEIRNAWQPVADAIRTAPPDKQAEAGATCCQPSCYSLNPNSLVKPEQSCFPQKDS